MASLWVVELEFQYLGHFGLQLVELYVVAIFFRLFVLPIILLLLNSVHAMYLLLCIILFKRPFLN